MAHLPNKLDEVLVGIRTITLINIEGDRVQIPTHTTYIEGVGAVM